MTVTGNPICNACKAAPKFSELAIVSIKYVQYKLILRIEPTTQSTLKNKKWRLNVYITMTSYPNRFIIVYVTLPP